MLFRSPKLSVGRNAQVNVRIDPFRHRVRRSDARPRPPSLSGAGAWPRPRARPILRSGIVNDQHRSQNCANDDTQLFPLPAAILPNIACDSLKSCRFALNLEGFSPVHALKRMSSTGRYR